MNKTVRPILASQIANGDASAIFLKVHRGILAAEEYLAVHQTLPLAERVHRALVRLVGQGKRVRCPELTGQLGFGQPLTGPHSHVHVMPVDVDDDGFIDHILLYASMGFGSAAIQAISRLRSLFGSGGQEICRFNIYEFDRLQFPSIRNISHQELGLNAVYCEGCCDWTSMTPFVPPRYVKESGRNTLVGQVQAELASRGLPSAVDVQLLPELSHAMRGFRRTRSRDAVRPPRDVGFAMKLTFVQQVTGPLCLGYGSHFGLGLFRASES